MLTVLQIVIGIVFILLLFSLLATTIMELVSAIFSLRGKHLWRGLRNMLGDNMLEHFDTHPFFRQLCENGTQVKSVAKGSYPSYLSPQAFRSILMDIVDKEDADPEKRFNHLPPGELRQVLTYLWRDSQGDDQVFQFKVEGWFNQVMERVSGWFKRRTQMLLLMIGLFLALLFNADTINIYSALSENAALRDQIEFSAASFMERKAESSSIALLPAEPSLGGAVALSNEFSGLNKSQLGLGWEGVDLMNYTGMQWMYKLVGWLTTALAISLGAPFWFDALRKLVNIRSSGTSYGSDQAVG